MILPYNSCRASYTDSDRRCDQVTVNGGLMQSIESSTATLQSRNGAFVWLVTLTGDGKPATVAVDTLTGDVVGLTIE